MSLLPFRPTSSKVVQAIFNILFSVKDKVFLDIFAGTGQIGLTALKKGAKLVVFVDAERERIKKIFSECQKYRFSDRCMTYSQDALKFLKNREDEVFDIIFADPPYDYKLYDKLIDECLRVLKKDGIFILEHRSNIDFGYKRPELLEDERVYGDTKLTFWRKV